VKKSTYISSFIAVFTIFLFLGNFSGFKLRNPFGEEATVDRYMKLKNSIYSSDNIEEIAIDSDGGKYHYVNNGETLEGIAKTYGTTIEQLKELNHKKDKRIKLGEKIKVAKNEWDYADNYYENRIIRRAPKYASKEERLKKRPYMVTNTYKLKHFDIKEFVDKKTYERFGKRSVWFVDNELMAQMDQLRELFGRPITINNWSSGGPFQWRGIRTPNYNKYTMYSQHSFGRAADFDVKGLTAEEARQKIKKWYDQGILISESMNVESEVTWVHIDLRGGEKWRTFRP